MNATGSLVPPPQGEDTRDGRQKALWAATHERVERFLPGLLAEVLPSLPPLPPSTVTTPTVVATPKISST